MLLYCSVIWHRYSTVPYGGWRNPLLVRQSSTASWGLAVGDGQQSTMRFHVLLQTLHTRRIPCMIAMMSSNIVVYVAVGLNLGTWLNPGIFWAWLQYTYSF